MARLSATVVTLMVVFALSTPHPLENYQEDTIPKPEGINIQDAQIPPVPEGELLVKNERTKRQFYYPSWTTTNAIVRIPPLQSYSLWQQPSSYTIKRPYLIPVWGAAGQIPIYLPPQPLYINSGYPKVNPPKNYPGLPYLPPNPSTDSPGNENTTKETDNKFGEGDGPVWDQVYGSSTTVRPTRRTKKPGQSPVTHPPLVHKDATPDTVEKSAATPIGSFRPNNVDPVNPSVGKDTPVLTNQPSRCVWAIISCCSANSQDVSYSCFEQQGCVGAFWDTSPCESEFARSAISAAMNYYNSK